MLKFRILFLSLAVIFLSGTVAHAISYQEGVRAAKDQNKPLYLYFYTDG